MNISDLAREYIPNVKLRGNGKLFRITNFVGVPMSIICVDGVERWSCNRDDEPRMIRDWNERHD